MSTDNIYLLTFVLVSILITYFFIKRSGYKSGCFTFGYVGLIISIINSLVIISWLFFSSAIKNSYNSFIEGDNYEAIIIDYDKQEGENMYTPVVRFVTKEGRTIERKLDFSSSDLKIGESYKVNYNKKKDEVITIGFVLAFQLIGPFIFCFILSLLFLGEILFVLNFNMKSYYSLLSRLGFYFLLPFLMICFNALLIYSLFYRNKLSLGISLLIGFFVIILTLSIVIYLKLLIEKGAPKKIKNSSSWDWD